MSVALLSMESQKALGFNQKYLNLGSEDEQRSYRFGKTEFQNGHTSTSGRSRFRVCVCVCARFCRSGCHVVCFRGLNLSMHARGGSPSPDLARGDSFLGNPSQCSSVVGWVGWVGGGGCSVPQSVHVCIQTHTHSRDEGIVTHTKHMSVCASSLPVSSALVWLRVPTKKTNLHKHAT